MTDSRPVDTIEFPLQEFDRAIADLIPKLPGPAKWRAFNAVRHLNWAWKLRDVDREMAVFRAITAEEEAATAIFLALRRRNYDGADKLRPRDHVHKNAVIPFFDAITRVIAAHSALMPQAQLFLDTDEDPPLLTFRFSRPHPITGEPAWAYPQPPLNVSVSSGRIGEPKKEEDFAAGVEEIVRGAKVSNIMQYLRNRATSVTKSYTRQTTAILRWPEILKRALRITSETSSRSFGSTCLLSNTSESSSSCSRP
jgi:hypothetical protein